MGEVTLQQEFEDRIKDRLRQDIGNLMPDEKLEQLCQKALEEIFFQTRRDKEKGNSYHSSTQLNPSWFEDRVDTLLRERMHKCISDLIKQKEAEIEEIIQATFAAAMPALVSALVIKGFTSDWGSLEYKLKDIIGGVVESVIQNNLTNIAVR